MVVVKILLVWVLNFSLGVVVLDELVECVV